VSVDAEPAEVDLDGIIDQVQSDPELGAGEKQTTISFASDEDVATAFTEEPSLIRRFLLHPHIAVDELRILHNDGTVSYLTPEEWDGEAVVGLDARIPVNILKVQSEARGQTVHSQIVSSEVLGNDPTGGDST